LILSACTGWFPLSILKVTFLIRNVHTSSQNRYVSRLPYSAQSGLEPSCTNGAKNPSNVSGA
jgi:hypothetical protein